MTGSIALSSERPITIAVDAMGGDHGPSVAVPAALNVLHEVHSLKIVLVGRAESLQPHLDDRSHRYRDRLTLCEASQVVAMDERPQEALRKKKDSSMRVALDLVKNGGADVCVSAGNTGALMATARFVLKTIPGIDRPAILSRIPAQGGHTHMLDLGANADCTAQHLLQFALMGSAVAAEVYGVKEPKVGLLNIGEEGIKGNELVQAAARLLAGSAVNYIGFVEGDDIFSGEVDVVVTDGFTGNIALKTMEGLAHMLGAALRKEYLRNPWRRLAALMSWPVLSSIRQGFDPRAYNGASMVGLSGIVIKSHGGADVVGFSNAIRVGLAEAKNCVPLQIEKLLGSQLPRESRANDRFS